MYFNKSASVWAWAVPDYASMLYSLMIGSLAMICLLKGVNSPDAL